MSPQQKQNVVFVVFDFPPAGICCCCYGCCVAVAIAVAVAVSIAVTVILAVAVALAVLLAFQQLLVVAKASSRVSLQWFSLFCSTFLLPFRDCFWVSPSLVYRSCCCLVIVLLLPA